MTVYAREFWITAEERFVSDNWLEMPVPEMAKKLGRSEGAVYRKASRLGLILPKKLSVSIDAIKDLIDFGYSSNRIGKELDCDGRKIRDIVKKNLDGHYQNKMRVNGSHARRVQGRRTAASLKRCEAGLYIPSLAKGAYCGNS